MELTQVRERERVARKIDSKRCVCLQFSSSSEETEKGLETGIRGREKTHFLFRGRQKHRDYLGKENPSDVTEGFIYSYITSYSQTQTTSLLTAYCSFPKKRCQNSANRDEQCSTNNIRQGIKRYYREHYGPAPSKKPKNIISGKSIVFFPFRSILQIEPRPM